MTRTRLITFFFSIRSWHGVAELLQYNSRLPGVSNIFNTSANYFCEIFYIFSNYISFEILHQTDIYIFIGKHNPVAKVAIPAVQCGLCHICHAGVTGEAGSLKNNGISNNSSLYHQIAHVCISIWLFLTWLIVDVTQDHTCRVQCCTLTRAWPATWSYHTCSRTCRTRPWVRDTGARLPSAAG